MPEIASILDSTKDALGVQSGVTAFDSQIIMHVNATLGNITQLGVGPEEGFRISDGTKTWGDLLGDNEERYAAAKDYMFLSVRMLFDPPALMSVLTAFKELRDEAAWRLNRAREDVVYPLTIVATLPGVPGVPSIPAEAMRFDIKAGLPFARRVRVANGKNFWSELADFEVRMQVRASKTSDSALLFDFTPWLVTSFDGNDILVEWNLTGAQTRTIEPGYFDLVLSDIGTIDGSAIQALNGYVRVLPTITAA